MINFSKNEKKLISLLIIVRILVLCLANLSHSIGDFDESADLLVDLHDPAHNQSLDRFVRSLLLPLARWDSVHSLSIANRGYFIEKQHAFFPLIPVAINTTGSLIHRLGFGYLSVISSHLLAGYFLSLITSTVAVLALYRLSLLVAHSKALYTTVKQPNITDEYSNRFAFVSACFFIISPANIHLSAVGYNEATYCSLTFMAFLILEQSSSPARSSSSNGITSTLGTWFATTIIALASTSRSNGLTNVVILISHFMQRVINAFYSSEINLLQWMHTHTKWLSFQILMLIAQCVTIMLPFLVYSYWASRSFCESAINQSINQSIDQSINQSINLPAYCRSSLGFTGFYNYIQSEYWNVGLFRYYTIAQIPNFLIALPSWMIAASAINQTIKQTFNQTNNQTVDQAINQSNNEGNNRSIDRSKNQSNNQTINQSIDQSINQSIKSSLPASKSERLFAFIRQVALGPNSVELKYLIHLSALFLVCVLILHVQVSTRFLTASPVMYWQMARLCSPSIKRSNDQTIKQSNNPFNEVKLLSRRRNLILGYCVAYTVIGSVLFGMFLPWT